VFAQGFSILNKANEMAMVRQSDHLCQHPLSWWRAFWLILKLIAGNSVSV
jgi:hypothetical protein